MNLWLVSVQLKNWWRISIGLLAYTYSFVCLFSGFPLIQNIPDLGKFLNILAGVSMSFGKWLFLYGKRNQFVAIMHQLNAKDDQLRKRANMDERVRKLRGDFYVQEMFVFILTTVFSCIFLAAMYGQVLLCNPLQLVVPTKAPFDMEPGSEGYWVIYSMQFAVSIFVTLFIAAADMMIGNLYNQLTLHLEVIHYDLELLDADSSVTSEEMYMKFCQFTREFQTIQVLVNDFQRCMRPFLINNIVATMVGSTFCCVELGIMVNVDITECVKPAFYFVFLNIPFFYWSWLGNRLREKVRNALIRISVVNGLWLFYNSPLD